MAKITKKKRNKRQKYKQLKGMIFDYYKLCLRESEDFHDHVEESDMTNIY